MSRLSLPVSAEDHTLGAADAPVTLVEYGDYQCPHCRRAHPIVKELRRLLGKRLRMVFRHFPLVTMHPHAELAAEAAEAAGAAGDYWGMHDILFDRQQFLDPPYLLTYAEELAIDVPTFADALQRRIHLPRVQRDFRSGVRSGVNGTPTFFINGERHDGTFDLDVLLEAVEQAAQVTGGPGG